MHIPDSVAGGELGPVTVGTKLETDGEEVEMGGPAAGRVA